ncbi:MAG: rod-binding protein [Bdellovibrionales bacterium]|jgi:Rod binding domain-containing protein|nr:rod-binding protein [Bdellovibrionales bacterium]
MRIALRLTTPFFFSVVTGVFVTNQAQASGQLQAGNPAQAERALSAAQTGGTAPAPVVRDPRVMEAARMYEKYFLGQMTKAMRSTVQHSDLQQQSMGEKIYREQLDDQYVDAWTESGGIGLADMIHDELIGKMEMAKQRRTAMRETREKMRTQGHAAMPLTDRDVLGVRRLPTASADARGAAGAKAGVVSETVLISLGKPQAASDSSGGARALEPEAVRSAWEGVLTRVQVSNESITKTILRLRAGVPPQTTGAGVPPQSGGWREIEVSFDGVPFQVTEGDRIAAGQVIGMLGRTARGILVRQTLVQDVLAKQLEESAELDEGTQEGTL